MICFAAMGTLKTRSAKFVLLLALMLPLQSFAWVKCSSPGAASAAAHQHCEDPAQHHHCGSCCVAAIAAMPLRLTPPSCSSSGISLPALAPLFKVALDRLDRPPRPVIR
jgi:hypothetical protein